MKIQVTPKRLSARDEKTGRFVVNIENPSNDVKFGAYWLNVKLECKYGKVPEDAAKQLAAIFAAEPSTPEYERCLSAVVIERRAKLVF